MTPRPSPASPFRLNVQLHSGGRRRRRHLSFYQQLQARWVTGGTTAQRQPILPSAAKAATNSLIKCNRQLSQSFIFRRLLPAKHGEFDPGSFFSRYFPSHPFL